MKSVRITLFFHFFLLIGFLSVKGQKLHTPSEILKIMEASPVMYEISMLNNKILPLDKSGNLNSNQYYRIENENQLNTFSYSISDELQKYLSKAEEYFATRKFSEARSMYMEALKVDSNYFVLFTYIGQTYGIEGDFDNAIKWYKEAIDRNYIDYMAHWFLADAYKSKAELDKAVDEITIAMILNRNHPRIDKSLKTIYTLKKLKTDEWTFNPQVKIDSISARKVTISADADWLAYAMVKALWKYEPDYKQSMGVNEGSYSTTEERESFIGLINLLNRKKLKKYPEFKALQLALNKDMIDEYIFYEIFLPEYPIVVYQLTEEFINRIKNYVIEVRGKQK